MKHLLIYFIAFLAISSLSAQVDQPGSFGKGHHSENYIPSFVREGAVFNPEWGPFFHGVASGDPLSDRVIIWTRITLDSMNTEPVDVDWRVATDPDLTNIVANGTFTTNPERDYTVKIDVTGLEAGTTYYYGFIQGGRASLTGKTKTTPTANVDHLKFGVVSCSNYQAGYFNSYGNLAARTDLDAVIHLGDYIYEYANFVYGAADVWEDRTVQPDAEIVSLEDYRTRYSTYRLDTNLARVHQQHPMLSIWDDHETTNDSYQDGAENHQPDTEGDWEVRKAVAKQAYFEWMPIRDTDESRVYRQLEYGNLADIILLDTRLEGREQQINDVTDPALYSPDRTILGAEQKQWLKDQLANSDAQWKVVAQQVIFSHFNVGWAALQDTTTTFEGTESIFLDIWDGYPAERTEIINFMDSLSIDDIVILTGDFHSAFAFDVTDQPINLQFLPVPGVGTLPFHNPSATYNAETGEGSVAVEFATPSVNSANFDENVNPAVAAGLEFQINNDLDLGGGLNLGNPNPHMKLVDLDQHGYYILDLKPDSATANYYYNPILEVSNDQTFGAAYRTLTTENRLGTGGESGPKAVQDIPAPAQPPVIISSNRELATSLVQPLMLHPNPATSEVFLTLALNESLTLKLEIVDLTGRLVRQLPAIELPNGVQSLRFNVEGLSSGTYFLRSTTANAAMVTKFLIK